jgi:hypothetical protein
MKLPACCSDGRVPSPRPNDAACFERVSMLKVWGRTAIIPVWFVAFGLFAVSRLPMTSATAVVLILGGAIALTLVLVLWKEPRPPIAIMRAPDPPRRQPPAADFVPNAWPDSGYRNVRHRGTRTRSGT